MDDAASNPVSRTSILIKKMHCNFQNEPVFEMKCQKENAHSQDVNSIAWNPVEETLVASASDDGSVKLWRLERESDDTI